MAFPDIFLQPVVQHVTDRINALTPESQPLWGTMNVAQMLAHCNVTYELALENKHPRPNALMRFVLKTFVKNMVVGSKPFKRNERTSPVFLVSATQDFDHQKQRLIAYLNLVQKAGSQSFDGKVNPAFGKLTALEWNNLFYKHIDHHLQQFGV